MKATSVFLCILALVIFGTGVFAALEADEYYQEYNRSRRYTYGYSTESNINKTYGDIARAFAFAEFFFSALLLFVAYALTDASNKMEEIHQKITDFNVKQTHEFNSLQKNLENSSKVYMRKLQEIQKSCTTKNPEEGVNQKKTTPSNPDENGPSPQAKRSRMSRLTSAPPDSGSLSDTPDRR